MYMPLGICENAAQYLPLAWNVGLGLYTWNLNDNFSRIVGSPAFMAIVLADTQARNITIKVPFQLLNLTLLPPIVDTPTQYFPCRPSIPLDSAYVLGRAFLQAAFLGFDYEDNVTYIAQAPGPRMEQSIWKTYQPNDTVISTSLATFASSWSSSWKVLEDDNTTSINNTTNINNTTSTNNTTSANNTMTLPQPTSSSKDHRQIPGGAIAGAVVGSVLGAMAIIAAVAFLWRKKSTRQKATSRNYNGTTAQRFGDHPISTAEHPSELAHWPKPSEVYGNGPSEAYGNAPPHEMEVPHRIQEVANQTDS